jgi:hypothetical protein
MFNFDIEGERFDIEDIRPVKMEADAFKERQHSQRTPFILCSVIFNSVAGLPVPPLQHSLTATYVVALQDMHQISGPIFKLNPVFATIYWARHRILLSILNKTAFDIGPDIQIYPVFATFYIQCCVQYRRQY